MSPALSRVTVLAFVVVTSACLPPTKTGKVCQSHADCEYDALWEPIEESVGQTYSCLKGPDDESGLCVRGEPQDGLDAGRPSDGGVVDDAGEQDDAGGGLDAGGGVDAGPGVDAGDDDGGADLPELEVVVSDCVASVDVTEARTTGLVVATRDGLAVEPRLTDIGLAGLVGLCVVGEGIGTFGTHLGRLRFTPADVAFDDVVTFAGQGGANARRVHFVVVDPADMKTWSPTAASDDVQVPQNWIPSDAVPQPGEVVFVPRSSSVPRFGAVATYAQALVVESGADALLTGGLGFMRSVLIGGRTVTDQNGKVLLHGAGLQGTDVGRAGGFMSALELRQGARARVVAPLVVERALLIASTTAELRPELTLDEPTVVQVGGELAVGSAGIFAGSGRLTVDHALAIVRVFGAIELRSLAENPSRLRAGAFEAWGDVTCVDGAADFEEGFALRLPGDPASPIETEVKTACALADVFVAPGRVALFSADEEPSVVADTFVVGGVALAASDVDVGACCLAPTGVIATTGAFALRVGGATLVEGTACVSGGPDAVHPLDAEVPCAFAPALCATDCIAD